MYIIMINIHGLVRANNIEIGHDADTGGQTKYVIDLIKELTEYKEITKIDLFTRQIKDKRVSTDYSVMIDNISNKLRIVRLPCGGGKYIRKERLWPHLDEYIDRVVSFLLSEGKIPDIIHGHYADAGYIASELSAIFGIPFVFTAHSLGRNKLSFLLQNGFSEETAEKEYSIIRRIKVEEKILTRVDLIITSTKYEKEKLYSPYNNCNIPEYKIIPPGINMERLFPYYDYELPGNMVDEIYKQAHFSMLQELQRFHFEPDKPLILSLCRPDSRKNIDLLIEIYGQDKELQAIANLAIFAGIREDITEMNEEEKQVLTDMLLLMDRYDLYGKMAIPKNHNPEIDVPELYRVVALKGGVLISTSYLETFGLTLIEASATGLPFIATTKGGPKDIYENCRSGILVDMENKQAVSKAIKSIITDKQKWEKLSNNGINKVRGKYIWKTHCRKYIKCARELIPAGSKKVYRIDQEKGAIGRRMSSLKYLLIVDIDDTLTGDVNALNELHTIIKDKHRQLGFGVATGRYYESAIDSLKDNNINSIDVVISSVGTEIYYSAKQNIDRGWANHIKLHWKSQKIHDVLDSLPFLKLQEIPDAQREFKISYYLYGKVKVNQALPLIHNMLSKAHLYYRLIFSHNLYIDIVPYRASKGKAVRYLSNKWKIPLDRIITAGNSGNDKDMLVGNTCAIVVRNYESELESIRKSNKVYFANNKYASGVIEGLKHYNII